MLIRSVDNIKQFLEVLNKVQKYISLPSKVEKEIKFAKIPFCHIHIFYSKYAGIIKNISLQNKDAFQADVTDYLDDMKNVAWLLFVSLRMYPFIAGKSNSRFNNKISSNANCLVACLGYVLLHSEEGYDMVIKDEKESPVVEHEFKHADKKAKADLLLATLCKSLGYSFDIEAKESIEKYFQLIEEVFLENLSKKRNQIPTAVDSERIMVTSRGLESVYQSMLTSNDIDESIFVKSDVVMHS